MPITTCIDMVEAAMRTAGVGAIGQTLLAEDANDGFQLLLEVIGMWKRQRFMAWRLIEEVFPAVANAKSYLLSDRPPRIDSAFARLMTPMAGAPSNVSPLDFPLWVLENQEEYNDIGLKELGTFPVAIWHSPGYPYSAVYPWPIPPEDQFELHIFYRAGLPEYQSLTDPLNLPPEYIRALRYELAALIQANYGKPLEPAFLAILGGTKATIKATNARVRELEMPGPLVPTLPGSGGISGAVGPHQSVIILNSRNAVLG